MCEDFKTVSGKELEISEISGRGQNTIACGTVGNAAFERWLAENNIHEIRGQISGQWEKFCLAVKEINGRKVLVIIGSDKRGTAYGLLELSRLMGVSP